MKSLQTFVDGGESINGLYFATCPFCGGHLVCNDNSFSCYSCGLHGDTADFIAEKNRVSRTHAMWQLTRESHKDVINVLKMADDYFQSRLKTNPYLEKRGISAETAKKFHLGWSDGKLLQYLLSNGADIVTIQRAGLLNSNGNDFFFKRLMFPIFNKQKQVVGFGGRIIRNNPDCPKYLNSPESPVFHKKENLFGIQNLNVKFPVYLVEGYMDALTLQSHDVNAVAALGTAVCLGHAQLLSSMKVKDIILSLDGDEAGVRNAMKALKALRGFNVKILCNYKDCKDPDEFIRKYGKSEFENLELLSKESFLIKNGVNPVDIL